MALEKHEGRIYLRLAGMVDTPPGAITEGALTDGLSIARSLKGLWASRDVKFKRATATIAGEKLLVQTDPLEAPSDDVAEFVRSKAKPLLAFPSETGCYAWQRLDKNFANEVLWTAAPAEQVEWMRETVSLAGCAPELVMPQVCALANAYSYATRPASEEMGLLVHAGARYVTLALMRGWAVLHGRDVNITREWFSPQLSWAERTMQALDRYWPEIERRLDGSVLNSVSVSGGAGDDADLIQALRTRCGTLVEPLDAFRRFSYQELSDDGRFVRDHGPSLAIAAGVALSAVCE